MNEFLNLLREGIPLPLKIADSFKQILESLLHFDALVLRKNRYFLNARFCIGRLELTRAGYGFVIPLSHANKQDWLVEKSLLKGAQRGDIVLARLSKNPHDSNRIRAKILAILESKEKFALCYLEKYKLDCIAISIPNEIPYKIKASQKSLKTLPARTLIKLNPQNGEILEILGALEDPKIDEILSLSLYDRQESFSMGAQIQSESFQEARLRDFKERTNCTHLPFCTIDPKDAKDHDDAIYFDASDSMLYVAIADVSHYVAKESPLDLEAKNRGFSIYFPHKSIPMLPRALSENLCSLREGKLRLAMVWKIRLHKRTKAVLSSELFEAVIKVRQKLTYEEVDELLINGTSKRILTTLKKPILNLYALTQKLRVKRLNCGFDFLGDEKTMCLDENLELQNLKIESQTPSHQLVEECMLLANQESAKLQTQKSNLQDETLKLGIYRVHSQPKPDAIVELFAELKALGVWQKAIPLNPKDFHKAILEVQRKAKTYKIESQVDKLIIKSMPQAFYASHNIGHFGLGFEAYSHFTSPIRRYSDLLLHRILKSKIKLCEDCATKESLPLLCEDLSQKERESAKVEMDFKDRKFARYLSQRIGQSFLGFISNDYKPEIVSLTTPPLQGARVVCLKGNGVKYQKVRVVIVEVNLATAKIYGWIVESYNESLGIASEQISKHLFAKMAQKNKLMAQKAKENAHNMKQKIKHNKQSRPPRAKFTPRHKRKGK
ncbi:ribonuclease R family protein [Helicobacter sp. MIT 05-5294]|uniref:RNB domain-containing ribonuclease n=1 Tax=Helicobacter sp. MIT 05-5294 TaxID=1548150 RepID=UPI00051FEDCF|nr:ribonuclease R family protein [Helicobacter sp. MIT 05-5294]TLD89091.1 RNB domain-containing ribonuclease [Helicobacter sp. MIT 05-5294]